MFGERRLSRRWQQGLKPPLSERHFRWLVACRGECQRTALLDFLADLRDETGRDVGIVISGAESILHLLVAELAKQVGGPGDFFGLDAFAREVLVPAVVGEVDEALI